MDAYSPDFVPHWTTHHDGVDEPAATTDEHRSAGDERALAELAERVSAARSIV